jgi:nitrate reductase NapE component
MRGGGFMKVKNTDIILQNKIFLYLAMGTFLILSIPLIAMQFKSDVNWTLSDFIVMGALLFGASSMFVLVARGTPRKYRTLIGFAFLAAVLWIWVELAVGLFTNWGI